jgi:uncharacterized protein YdeI (YjbR/CyaY-like superfamily)
MRTVKAEAIDPALVRALGAQPRLRETFAGMPRSHQREYSIWIGSAKKPETKERRVQGALKLIAEWGKERAAKSKG